MLTYLTLNVLIYAYLFGAVIDMAVRSNAAAAQDPSLPYSPWAEAIKALTWPIKRPIDVVMAVVNGVRGAGRGV